MRALVLGDDGPSHALVWKLFGSDRLDSMAAVPGNGGAGMLVPVTAPRATVGETVRWAYEEEFRLIVPSSSEPLEDGLVEEATPLRVAVWGAPSRSALLQRSRMWAKEFLNRYQLPTAPGRAFPDRSTAERYLAAQPLPVLLWGDYPSEFDGAYNDRSMAMAAIEGIFALPPRPNNFRGVVIEAPVLGPTVAYSCFTDGETLVPLPPVRIYDRLQDGDASWAAPGMGAHTSLTPLLGQVGAYIHKQVMEPLLAALRREALPWWGVLGVDCTITAEGPRVTRIRATLSDPEAQVLLPCLQDDLLPIIAACNSRTLHSLPPLRWQQEACVGVTLVAQGYPYTSPTHLSIKGLETLEPGVLAFHNQTFNPNSMPYVSVSVQLPEKRSLLSGFADSFSEAMLVRPSGPPQLVSHAGRILTVVARGADLAAARARAYANLARISVPHSFHRTDIGLREL